MALSFMKAKYLRYKRKETVKEVKYGIECGMTIENFNDIKEYDIIECYQMVEEK